MTRSLLIACRFDSFTRAGKMVGDLFRENGYRVDYCVLRRLGGELYRRAYQEIGLMENTPCRSLSSLCQNGDLLNYDAVYIGETGAGIRSFQRQIRDLVQKKQSRRRPILMCGYPGVILKDVFSGYSMRCGCDIVLLNSEADCERYRNFCSRYGLDDSGATLWGYPFHERYVPHAIDGFSCRVLFVEQAVMPKGLKERIYIVNRLVEYDNSHPQTLLIVKPRLRPGEQALFVTNYHFKYIMRSFGKMPSNLILSYGDINQLISEADACLTVSSTVALQVMAYGIPTCIISDFGVRNAYGTDFFQKSGCLRSMSAIIAGDIPMAEPVWVRHNVAVCRDHAADLIERVEHLCREREQRGEFPFNENYERVFAREYLEYHYSGPVPVGVKFRVRLGALVGTLRLQASRLMAQLLLGWNLFWRQA